MGNCNCFNQKEEKKFELPTSASPAKEEASPNIEEAKTAPPQKLKFKKHWDKIAAITGVKNIPLEGKTAETAETEETFRPRIIRIETKTDYGITIVEVENKKVDPSEVFYTKNMDPNRHIRNSTRQNPGIVKKQSVLDDKITEQIAKNADFDKLFDDILSKQFTIKK